jgi:hypothetical protein
VRACPAVVTVVTFSFAGFSGVEKFLVASCEDGLFFIGEFVGWGDVADRGVKPHGVVVFDEADDQATSVLEIHRVGNTSLGCPLSECQNNLSS